VVIGLNRSLFLAGSLSRAGQIENIVIDLAPSTGYDRMGSTNGGTATLQNSWK